MDKTVVRLVGAAIVAALALAATSMGEIARRAVGLLVGLPSFSMLILGRWQLGKSFSIMPRAKALVTTGLYSRIEHPMYFFLDMLLIALIVALGLPILLVAWGILVVVHVLQVRREEKVLAAAFGVDYEIYRKRTWF